MKLKSMLSIMDNYIYCHNCRSDKVGNGAGSIVVDKDTLTRSCKCGWKIKVDEVGNVISQTFNSLELHYFTFGMGHDLAGHVQPILAINEDQARKEMVKTYGNKWAFQYDKTQWEYLKKLGFGGETVLEPINMSGGDPQ